jgi:hypothetical protein
MSCLSHLRFSIAHWDPNALFHARAEIPHFDLGAFPSIDCPSWVHSPHAAASANDAYGRDTCPKASAARPECGPYQDTRTPRRCVPTRCTLMPLVGTPVPRRPPSTLTVAPDASERRPYQWRPYQRRPNPLRAPTYSHFAPRFDVILTPLPRIQLCQKACVGNPPGAVISPLQILNSRHRT